MTHTRTGVWREPTGVRPALLTALVLALAAGCSNGKAGEKDDGEAAATTVPVEVQPLRRAAMVAVYSGTAPVEAHEEAEVVAKVGGEVRQLLVEDQLHRALDRLATACREVELEVFLRRDHELSSLLAKESF